MDVSIWYVYLDHSNNWLGDGSRRVDELQSAKEFYSEREAQAAAENHNGVVLGWCQ